MFMSFLSQRDGTIALTSGLLIGTIALGVAGAVDYTNAIRHKKALQSALDASALAGVVSGGETDAEREAAAINHFQSTAFCETADCSDTTASHEGDVIVLASKVKVPTHLLKIAGKDNVEVDAQAKAAPSGSDQAIEVMMALDYSGSMNLLGKYTNMANAATGFLTQLEDAPNGNRSKAGIVPFSEYVLAPLDGRYAYDVANRTDLTGLQVVGCAMNRAYPHAVSVETPTASEEGSLWPLRSFAVGSSADGGGYSEDYQPAQGTPFNVMWDGIVYSNLFEFIDLDPNAGAFWPTYETVPGGDEMLYEEPYLRIIANGLAIRQVSQPPFKYGVYNNGMWPKETVTSNYNGYAGAEGWGIGSENGLSMMFAPHLLAEQLDAKCKQYVDRKLWLRPLSTDFSGMRAAIGEMRPLGLTNIALAMDFAWHGLSENEPYAVPADTEADVPAKKIAILLTDGVQTVKAHGPGNTISVTSANKNIAEICEAMKADEINVFTVAFGIQDGATRRMLENCASGPTYYYEPSAGADLTGVFDGIFETVARSYARIVD